MSRNKPQKLDRAAAIDSAVASIERMFGKGAIMKFGDSAPPKVESISTGSISIDLALGIGGVPKGRVVEIYGRESSGKTTLMLEVRKGGVAARVPVSAEESGARGDRIRVRALDSKRSMTGVVRSRELVVIDLGQGK